MVFTWDWYTFFLVILSLLGISLVVLGILTAYFGSGKSRAVGFVLLIVGIIVGLLTYTLAHFYMEPPNGLIKAVILPTVFYVVATIV